VPFEDGDNLLLEIAVEENADRCITCIAFFNLGIDLDLVDCFHQPLLDMALKKKKLKSVVAVLQKGAMK
jgi:hypothetical protein